MDNLYITIGRQFGSGGRETGKKVAEALGIRRSGIYCVGDNENDISMLKISAIPFAPKNAIPAVKETPGVVVLPHCKKGAIGALIRHLDAIY